MRRTKKLNMPKVRLLIIFIVAGLFWGGWSLNSAQAEKYKTYPLVSETRVKNIILLIGDGMGISQLAAARIKLLGARGRLHMERMPVSGLVDTYSANNLVTDSAAAGTAIATGFKTDNGKISIAPDGKRLPTIMEACIQVGKSTGLIVTSRVTHATPAVFAAHVKSRDNEAEIASQMIRTGVNVILGGGKDYFVPSTMRQSKRQDRRNLLMEARQLGYQIIETAAALKEVSAKYVLGLFQMKSLTTKKPEPSLAEMTRKGIQLLNKNPQGFFLMVEGSQIDWECHDHKKKATIRQVRLFDEAVKVALHFALKSRETLVIVTADHETGGMAINKGSLSGKRLAIGWTTSGHTAQPVPLFAFGPRAQAFTGLYDNTRIVKIMVRLLRINDFPGISNR
jgi:alkaline phosphatase